MWRAIRDDSFAPNLSQIYFYQCQFRKVLGAVYTSLFCVIFFYYKYICFQNDGSQTIMPHAVVTSLARVECKIPVVTVQKRVHCFTRYAILTLGRKKITLIKKFLH